jgi:hypothetical protein
MTKQVVTALKMTPVTEAVSIPFVTQFLDDEGVVRPNEVMESSAKAMLDELVRYTDALPPLRRDA